jgi:hypothetical protein
MVLYLNQSATEVKPGRGQTVHRVATNVEGFSLFDFQLHLVATENFLDVSPIVA